MAPGALRKSWETILVLPFVVVIGFLHGQPINRDTQDQES